MPVFAKAKFVFPALALLIIHSYGWKTTEINISGLFRDFHLAKPLATELAQPDLFSREKQSQTRESGFLLRMPTIIGFADGGGIGFLLQQWISLLKHNEAGHRITRNCDCRYCPGHPEFKNTRAN